MLDDPYYYLYYGKAARYPSYFTLELEGPEVGRVLRFDSLSKILSAGIRIGFASGPVALLQAIDQHVCQTYESSFRMSDNRVISSNARLLINHNIQISAMRMAANHHTDTKSDCDFESADIISHTTDHIHVTGVLGV